MKKRIYIVLLNSGNKTIHYLSISGFKAVFPCFIIYIIYSDTHCSPSPLVQLLKYSCAKKQNKNKWGPKHVLSESKPRILLV